MALEQMGALATGWLSLFCLAASMFGSVSALGAAWAARWFVRRPASLTPMRWPDISILKPLSGIEARLSENIETYFNQDYPGDIQFVFGVQDPDDGAIPVIEALMRRYPQLDLHWSSTAPRTELSTAGAASIQAKSKSSQIQPSPG
jgi:ceramide glucosyltransferase